MLFKKIFTALSALLLCIAFGAQAQQFDMQKMMQMQNCFSKIDQQALNQFAQEGQALQSKLKSLCRAGQRSEAQTIGMEFAMDMLQNKEMQQLKQCSEMARGMMPSLNKFDFPTQEELKNRHVCDEI